MNKTIHKVGEMVGIPSRETDQILAQVRANTAKLEGCSEPHDFSIALNRHTKQPLPNPTPQQTFGCRWQCSKCGGHVDAIDKSWYNRGLVGRKLNDLNACYEAEEKLDQNQRERMMEYLHDARREEWNRLPIKTTEAFEWMICHATAAQRWEAINRAVAST